MYLKKINLKAFEDYLKNPTDPFLEGNICITDGVVKYFRFVRTPAQKENMMLRFFMAEHKLRIIRDAV